MDWDDVLTFGVGGCFTGLGLCGVSIAIETIVKTIMDATKEMHRRKLEVLDRMIALQGGAGDVDSRLGDGPAVPVDHLLPVVDGLLVPVHGQDAPDRSNDQVAGIHEQDGGCPGRD